MSVQAVAAQIEDAILAHTGFSVNVTILGSGPIICCTREGLSTVKAIMTLMSNVTLESEYDWQGHPDFQDFPIQINYRNV